MQKNVVRCILKTVKFFFNKTSQGLQFFARCRGKNPFKKSLANLDSVALKMGGGVGRGVLVTFVEGCPCIYRITTCCFWCVICQGCSVGGGGLGPVRSVVQECSPAWGTW
jgi:hypothetical protein